MVDAKRAGQRDAPAARPDPAQTDGLADSVSELLPALEAFGRYEGPDLAVPRSDWLPLIDEPVPEEGAGAEAVLRLLNDVVIARGLRLGHPGFSGWVTTAPTTIATAADLAQTVASAQRWWAQPGNHLDTLAARWMIELLGFPDSYVGAFTAGGSTATLVGLGAARQYAGEKIGIDPSADGIEAMPAPRVYATSSTHRVAMRALGVLGLGRINLREVALDASRRADMADLKRLIDEDLAAGRTAVAIIGNAGDANMGIVDPLPEMARLAEEYDIWFHVDAAYGGFGLLDPRVADRFGDVATYDSFCVDPHKWLAAPLGTGLAICRDGAVWSRAFTIEPGHYDAERHMAVYDDREDVDSVWSSPGSGTPDWGVDFSAPARGVAVWAVLKEIGVAGVRERVARHIDFARHVADRARTEPELELLSDVHLSIVCFRYVPGGWQDGDRLDDLNVEILAELRRRGLTVPSYTRVDGRYALRACYINPRTRWSDVDLLVDQVLEIGRARSAG